MDWRAIALVALGGALCAASRFGVSSMLPRLAFPWHTLLVNLAGSLLIGYLMMDHGTERSLRLLLAVGFLGAFTTLSTYSMETVELWRENRIGMAMANILANGIGGPLLALLGWRIARLAGS